MSSAGGVIGATGDTLRWLALDNPLSQAVLSGISHMAGSTQNCVRQARAGPLETSLRQPPVRWLLTGPGRGAVRLAGLSGASAVALGAYGAHKLKANRDANPELVQVFDTANRYHMLHSLALLGAPLSRRPALVAALLSTGMLVFSGTCYYYALTGDGSVRKFTPYGGMLLIAGWLAMAL